MSPLQSQIIEEVRGVVDRGLATIVSAIEREMLRRQAAPAFWFRVHSLMAQRLPKWRVLARAHHRRMARRYEAMQDAACLVAAHRVGLDDDC